MRSELLWSETKTRVTVVSYKDTVHVFSILYPVTTGHHGINATLVYCISDHYSGDAAIREEVRLKT